MSILHTMIKTVIHRKTNVCVCACEQEGHYGGKETAFRNCTSVGSVLLEQ